VRAQVSSLKTTSICVVEADGTAVWEGKTESEPAALIKALLRWRGIITLVGVEACPLSEWLYGALVESGFQPVCIETRHAQRFLSSRPNKTDRSDARGIADMMRLGHYRTVHVKSKASQLLRTVLIARKKFVDHMLAIENTIRGLLLVGLAVVLFQIIFFAQNLTVEQPSGSVEIDQRGPVRENQGSLGILTSETAKLGTRNTSPDVTIIPMSGGLSREPRS
jgi:Transposase